MLLRGDDPATVGIPPQTVASARDALTWRVPVTSLLHVLRLTVAAAWAIVARRLTAQAADDDHLAEAVTLTSAWLLEYTDATRFVRRELGGLADDDDTTRRLAATLLVYLDEQSSSSRTARRLALHDNTIRYRIRQAEQLLGRVSARSPDRDDAVAGWR